MQTFAELLNEYTRRTGTSDSELARMLNVSRQTIFRWKEGLVEKPRYREDVVRIAATLRLTPSERDELLLSAGFPPETPVSVITDAIPDIQPATPVSDTDARTVEQSEPRLHKLVLPRGTFTFIGIILVLLFGAAVLVRISELHAEIPSAAPGETLVILTPLKQSNDIPAALPVRRLLGSEPQPAQDPSLFLQAAIERELVAARLDHVRVVVIASQIADAAQAQQVLRRSNASMVIWGTATGDHLEIGLAVPPLASRADDMPIDALIASPLDETFNIATASQNEIRLVALVATAHLQLESGDFGRARATLVQALASADLNPRTQGLLDLHAGYIAQIAKPPELDRAIQFYGEAIAQAPEMPVAYLNRGVAFIRRNDPPQWQSDLTHVLSVMPDHLGAHLALCWAFALDQQPQAALPHCDRAASLDATPRSREPRAIVRAQLKQFADAENDMQAFVDWLSSRPESLRVRYGTNRTDWLSGLKAGQNPFDERILEKLRQE